MNATNEFPLSGLGLGASMDDALRYCDWRERGQAQWQKLGYLVLGLASRDVIPPGLGNRLRESGLGHSVHLSALNLMQPLREQRALADHLFRSIEKLEPACVEEDLGLWTWGKLELMNHMLNPVLDERTLEIAAENVTEIMRLTGLPFFAENPPVYFDVGPFDMLSFVLDLSKATSCGLVLDIGHIVGYCNATDRDPFDYLAGWSGFDRVREVHVAGFDLFPDLGAPMWYDNHGARIPEFALDLIAQSVKAARRPLPITLEQEGAEYRLVADHITRVSRRFFEDHGTAR